MADAAVTRSLERMLKDAQGKKYHNLQNALKAYLDRRKDPEGHAVGSSDTTPKDAITGEKHNDDQSASLEEPPSHFKQESSPGASQATAATMTEVGHTLEGPEADLIWQPLKLALETNQPKLVEPALDCLHKLISYGHLEGDAGLHNGKNTVMLTDILSKVCSCADNSSSDNTVLQVIKVILTTVASTKFQVHGECLLTAIRTCYNIVLNSKSPVNQATAKATLTQMVSIVFKRMESDTQICENNTAGTPVLDSKESLSMETPSSQIGEGCKDSMEGEAQEGAGQSTVTVEELQHLAGDADIKGLEAVLDKAVYSVGGTKTKEGLDLESLSVGESDALLVFRTISKMSMKEGNDDMIIRTKNLSLELLQGLLETVSHSFTVNYAFLDSVKTYLCSALLRSCVSNNAAVFQLACRIFLILLSRFRESLKAEIGVFFPLIVLRSLDSGETSLPQRTAVLRMLEKVCLDSQMLADIFVNYDCNLEATNLFERMVSSLSRMAQGTPNADPNSIALSQNIALKGSALQCLVNVLRSLVTWTKMHDEVKQRPYNRDAWEGGQSEGSLVDASKEVTQADEFGKVKAQKITLEAAISEFNRRPSKGIELLVSNKLVSAEPVAVAQFLKSTPGLDKAMVGDYLGQHEEFQISVMHAFVNSMNFQDMKFDLAIREFLKGFRLPGEAQKIDRIMEKFAERYCHDNPGLFKNADTAYVLAYAIILLNTDAHNPMVWPKMSKSEFVRMNSGTESEEQAPQQLLEEIYDSIVKDEIKMKDDNGRKKLDSEEKGRLVTILNLGFSRRKSNADAKQEHEDIIRRTQALFRKGGVKRGVFYRATHVELARPMLEAVGWPLLAAFSVTMEDSDNKPRVSLCMEGFRCGIHLTEVLGMDTMRYAFLTSLIRFTFLHAPKEMRGKNVEVLKTLLALSENEPNALRDTWNAVLECISRLEYITSSPTILATLMHGSNQISRDALAQSLIELTGKPIEQVFVNSSKFPSDVIVEFFTALCGVSAEELKQNPPRVFSLQKLVEISYYNMARIRMVWGRIWLVLSQHFVSAGSHQDEKIAMYAIDSLRQLGMKYLERVELANFTFQNDILKPFVVLMRNSRRAVIRGLIVDCIVQMIKSKVGNIRSGWKSVFMIFTTAAFDDTESIADLAFESVEQVVLEHFDQVAGDCFMDCVNCLIAFANNKISSRTSLKSIALLRICEDRLAEGHVPGGDSKCVETIGSGVDLEVVEYYWFPMLAGLSDLTSDPRLEVRNCALEVLFDLLNERGHKFSASFWESVFHRVLFPIFDYVRHAGKDGEKTASADQWLRETCIHSLQLLCDLFSNFYKEVSFLLPSLLGLLLDCATRPDQALASISVGALVRLTEVGGHQFTEKDWSTLLESINNVCYTTQPVELLNPEHAFGYTSDYASKKMGVGTLPTKSHQAAEGAYSDVESLENYESGVGTPTSSSNGVVSKSSQRLSLDTRDGDYQETEVSSLSPLKDNKHTSNGPASKSLSSRGFMGNMMDTLLLKNLTFKSKNVSGDVPMPTPPKEHDMEDENQLEPEEDNPLLQSIRSKCLIQLLLLGAIDSLQRKHWLLLKPPHKILIMDTLLSMVDFASSYNSDASLRFRMQQFSGERPPPNLLRQEIEATQLYLSVLTRAASFIDGNDSKHAEHDLVDQEYKAVSSEEDKLREEAERRLITFFSHILKDAVNLEAGAGEVVQAEAHRSLSLRSSVIVKVLNAMSKLDIKIFKRHLSEFYPYFTKLICSSQMDVRRALGDLFKSRLVALLP